MQPENITVHTLTLKRASRIVIEDQKENDYADVAAMLEKCHLLAEAGYRPYYLYRQKNTLQNLENVGWCKPGHEGYYNIYIMEEVQTILSAGAGGSTKLVADGGKRMQRNSSILSIRTSISSALRRYWNGKKEWLSFMITIWVPKRLVEIDLYNVAARSPQALAQLSENSYARRVQYAAQKVRGSGAKIVMADRPFRQRKDHQRHCLAKALVQQAPRRRWSVWTTFLKVLPTTPKCRTARWTTKTLKRWICPHQAVPAPAQRDRQDRTAHLRFCHRAARCRSGTHRPAGRCVHRGGYPCPQPELTGLVPDDQIYRIYAGLREEYCIDGRRVINTQDIRLCRRTLRDAAARGRSPAKTLSMWDRVLDGETRYIKGFKTTADFLLDTSFTYELGLISRLLGEVRRQFTLEATTPSCGTRPPAASSR